MVQKYLYIITIIDGAKMIILALQELHKVISSVRTTHAMCVYSIFIHSLVIAIDQNS